LGVTGLALVYLSISNFTAKTIQNIHMVMKHIWSYIECWYWFWRTVSHIRLIINLHLISQKAVSLFWTAIWTEAAYEIVAIIQKNIPCKLMKI